MLPEGACAPSAPSYPRNRDGECPCSDCWSEAQPVFGLGRGCGGRVLPDRVSPGRSGRGVGPLPQDVAAKQTAGGVPCLGRGSLCVAPAGKEHPLRIGGWTDRVSPRQNAISGGGSAGSGTWGLFSRHDCVSGGAERSENHAGEPGSRRATRKMGGNDRTHGVRLSGQGENLSAGPVPVPFKELKEEIPNIVHHSVNKN